MTDKWKRYKNCAIIALFLGAALLSGKKTWLRYGIITVVILALLVLAVLRW